MDKRHVKMIGAETVAVSGVPKTWMRRTCNRGPTAEAPHPLNPISSVADISMDKRNKYLAGHAAVGCNFTTRESSFEHDG